MALFLGNRQFSSNTTSSFATTARRQRGLRHNFVRSTLRSCGLLFQGLSRKRIAYLRFELTAEQPRDFVVNVCFAKAKSPRPPNWGFRHHMSVALRRGLSELRDNIIARHPPSPPRREYSGWPSKSYSGVSATQLICANASRIPYNGFYPIS